MSLELLNAPKVILVILLYGIQVFSTIMKLKPKNINRDSLRANGTKLLKV